MALFLLVTDPRFVAPREPDLYARQILLEDRLLSDALMSLGHGTRRVAWSDPAVHWDAAEATVLRTPWDWFSHADRFRAWVDRVAPWLLNPAATVHWNLHKRYLLELEAAGVPVVPTELIDGPEAEPLAAVLERRGWTHGVVKPAVSAAGWNTWRVGPDSLPDISARMPDLLAHGTVMVQPFVPSVLTQGELSLMVFGGRATHAVRKVPASGEFRVQDDHGGTCHPHQATDEEITFAEQAVLACPGSPAYARVDVVRDATGGLRLMELELVEPELFLRLYPPSAAAFAHALDTALRSPLPAR